MTELTVRPARPDEYAVLGELRARAYVEGGLLCADHFYVKHLREVAVHDGSDVLVAVDADDRPLGAVTVAVVGSDAAEIAREGELEFRMLAVLPDAQGLGVGALLVDACVQRARDLRLRRVVISVADDNERALRLYGRLGFVRQPERDWSPTPDVHLLGHALDL